MTTMRFFPTALLLLVMLATATSLEAQRADKGRDGFEFEAYAGVFYPKEPAFGAGEVQFTLDERQLTFGARLGWTFHFNMFLQAEGGYVPLTMVEEGGTERNINTLLYGGSIGYNLQFSPEAQFFILVGGGIMHWDPDGLPQENQLRGHFGGGLRIFLTRGVALRFEGRDHLLPKTLSETRGNLNPGLTIADELTHNIEISGGITLFFGVHRDDDKDRVFNEYDRCPATPRGAPADARGCPLDSDEDGVIDQIDRCSHTLPGAPVDERGCPTDSDGDGVPDGIDRCGNTPQGVQVDEFGCPFDADGDGVPDGLDSCPNTPTGVQVDESGCPVDSDGDGVPDGLDRCPNTPAEREVDENGCTRIQAGLEAGRLVLSSIYFRTNSADLLPTSRRVLDEVGQALLDRPEAQIEIQGHTDASGAAGYNLQLSERRALAVFQYLTGTYPGLERGRFTVRGYGESRPIASNDTPDGMALNRRVEFVVRNQ
ncbi:MAG: OmpA family protein [Gemmatimonadota bacterium]|nr:MAG: OmpA family protein [Gemmatimonadota bacterium]